MNSTRRGGLNSTALALIPLAIAINIAGGQLVKALRLPIYLDSIGTVLAGALLGPWVGLLTGALSNIIWTGIGLDQYAISFAPVAAIIGLLAGFAGRLGAFQQPAPRWLSALIGGVFLFALTLFVMMFINATSNPDGSMALPNAADLFAQQPFVFIVAFLVGLAAGYFVLKNAGYAGLAGLLTGIVAAMVSAPIAAYVFGGVTGSGTDLLVAAFRASGAGILQSAFAQGTVSDPFDKMTSFMVVYLIIQALPRRLLYRFPNTRVADDAQQIGELATGQ
jgi:energy-coupling factor transport system substrate-specific component